MEKLKNNNLVIKPLIMLSAFPKDFSLSQVEISQGYFPKWQLPKCGISQTATSQACPSRSSRPLDCSSRGVGPLVHPIRSTRPPLQPAAPQRAYNLTFGELQLEKLHIWEVATWEIVIWEVTFGKMPLEKYLMPLLIL